MRTRDAIGRAVRYHLRAVPPTLVGLAVVAAGVWYGFVDAGSPTAVAPPRLAVAAGLVCLGVAVAAVGRTAVRLDATASAVAAAVDREVGLGEEDLRETVAIAAERAVADSVDGAADDLAARVTDAVETAGATTGETPPAAEAITTTETAGVTPSATVAETAEAADAEAAAAAVDGRETTAAPDALADATRRASERVESYLASDEGDVGEFRQLAEGARVLDDEGPDAAGAGGAADADRTGARTGGETPRTDGAEILGDDPSDPHLPDGGDVDDAEIIDDESGMVFGEAVRDPDGEA